MTNTHTTTGVPGLPSVGEIWYEQHCAVAYCEILAVEIDQYHGPLIRIRNSSGSEGSRMLGKTLEGKMALVARCHMSRASAPVYVRECDLRAPIDVMRAEQSEREKRWLDAYNARQKVN